MPDVTANYGKPFDFIAVLGYIIINHSCLNCYIFTKLSQIVCLINVHIRYVTMPDLTTSYGRLFDLNTLVCEFSNIITC